MATPPPLGLGNTTCDEVYRLYSKDWVNITAFPTMHNTEVGFYVFCMVVAGLSLAHCAWVKLLSPYPLDFLKGRSFGILLASWAGPLLQFQIGGLSLALNSQIPCWFQALAPILLIPVTVAPMMVRTITFKGNYLVALAAAKGISSAPATAAMAGDDGNSAMGESNIPGSSLGGLGSTSASQVASNFTSGLDMFIFAFKALWLPTRISEDVIDPDEVRKWRFLARNRGSLLATSIVMFPYLLVALISVLIDPLYSTSCLGCSLTFNYSILLIILAAVSIIVFVVHNRTLKGVRDPFQVTKDSTRAAVYGATIALLGYILNIAARPTSDRVASWNVMLAVGFLIMGLCQTELPIAMALWNDRRDVSAAAATQKVDKKLAANGGNGSRDGTSGAGGGGAGGGATGRRRSLLKNAGGGNTAVAVSPVDGSGNGIDATTVENSTSTTNNASSGALPASSPTAAATRQLRSQSRTDIASRVVRRVLAVRKVDYTAAFDIISANETLLAAFEKYLVSEHASESLAFIQAVEAFRRVYYEQSARAINLRAKKLVKTYVGWDSTFPINISADATAAIVRTVRKFADKVDVELQGKVPYEVFDDAVTDIVRLLVYGPVVRFLRTPEWKKFVEDKVVDMERIYLPQESIFASGSGVLDVGGSARGSRLAAPAPSSPRAAVVSPNAASS